MAAQEFSLQQLQPFLDRNPGRGALRVQVSTGRGLFPVEGARVEIYRYFGPERTVFYEGVTDSSGIVEGIRRLDAPAGPADRLVPVIGDGGDQRHRVSGIGAPPAVRHGGRPTGRGVPADRDDFGGVTGIGLRGGRSHAVSCGAGAYHRPSGPAGSGGGERDGAVHRLHKKRGVKRDISDMARERAES